MIEQIPLLLRLASAIIYTLAAIQAESSLPNYGCPLMAAALFAYLWNVRGFWLVPSLCMAGQLCCLHFDYLDNGRFLSFFPFLLMVLLLLLDAQQVNDTEPDFGKCESEIRQIFWKHDPAKLHLVDQMLKDSRGRELGLLRDLRKEYNLPDETISDVYRKGYQDEPEEATVAQIRQEIINLVRLKDPSKERLVDKIMAANRGRERILVEDLFREYNVALPSYLAASQKQQRGSYKPWALQPERVLEEEKLRAREAVARNLSTVNRMR